MSCMPERTRKKIRRTITGTSDRPRLTVHRSLLHLRAQLIDDTTGKTIATAHSLKLTKSRSKKAIEVGKEIAKLAQEKKIKQVVFDRAGAQYLGVIKIIADTVREQGVKI